MRCVLWGDGGVGWHECGMENTWRPHVMADDDDGGERGQHPAGFLSGSYTSKGKKTRHSAVM